jgi:LuxR family maltose regulon positive regulatory protein
MLFLLAHLPPHMCLVIASRADPPWPLALAPARNQRMRPNLRFTIRKRVSFNQVSRLNLRPEDIAAG